jgi:hypothetical protein
MIEVTVRISDDESKTMLSFRTMTDGVGVTLAKGEKELVTSILSWETWWTFMGELAKTRGAFLSVYDPHLSEPREIGPLEGAFSPHLAIGRIWEKFDKHEEEP